VALRLIRQGTGLYAVFNTATKVIDVYDLSPASVVDYLFAHDAGATMSWSAAIQTMREAHGWAAVGEILDSLAVEDPPAG
jgi:hypothetical protein